MSSFDYIGKPVVVFKDRIPDFIMLELFLGESLIKTDRKAF
jgi:hypothetical protein